MALTPRLELRQSQQLIMTPQLQQAIKLLQLSNLELTDYVEQEVEKNPLLDYADAAGGEAAAETEAETAPDTPAASGDDGALGPGVDERLSEGGDSNARDDAPLDVSYENDFTNDSPADAPREAGAAALGADWSSASAGGYDGGENRLEQTISGAASLRDHLLEQLSLLDCTPAQRLIGQYLVDSVDDAGYLVEDVRAIAEKLGAEEALIEETLTLVQSFEPTGVFARNLGECLALQLAERDRCDPAMRLFLDHLDLLAERKLDVLRRICDVDDDDLNDMIAEIRTLNPRPGDAFSSERIQPVVPDVFVRENAEGGWTVELNSDTLPRVLLNARYYAQVNGAARSKSDKAYITDCLTTANWLVKALDQRAKTILKVSSEIVRQQDGFLAHGVIHLKPLNLRTIAEAIDMHESTVSRVTSNKYIATPRGIFELKYFFTSSINSSEGGEAHSAEAVRHRIRELIEAEQPGKILSDDKIVQLLRDSGVDIARRTVAKYREAMGIPSSVQRRRLKAVPA